MEEKDRTQMIAVQDIKEVAEDRTQDLTLETIKERDTDRDLIPETEIEKDHIDHRRVIVITIIVTIALVIANTQILIEDSIKIK